MKGSLGIILFLLVITAAVVDISNYKQWENESQIAKFSLMDDCRIDNFHTYELQKGTDYFRLNSFSNSVNVLKDDYYLLWYDYFGNRYGKAVTIYDDKSMAYEELIGDVYLTKGTILVTDDYINDLNADLVMVIFYNDKSARCLTKQYRILKNNDELVVEKVISRVPTEIERHKVKPQFLEDLKEIEGHLFSYTDNNMYEEEEGHPTVEFLYLNASRIYRYGEGVQNFFTTFEEILAKHTISSEMLFLDE